ncbi:MAG TPA: hypothetical protein VF062_08765 [Candidatus Limnocylindrales bacterium]
MKPTALPALLTALVLAATGQDLLVAKYAAEYFVATDGNDTAAGTFDAPWQNLSVAMARLRAGDTLNVRGGTYYEGENIRPVLAPGTAAARITMRAFETERVVIESRFDLRNPSYWTFDGLNVTGHRLTEPTPAGLSSAALSIVDGTGWIYRNGEICCIDDYATVTIIGEAKDWHFTHNVVWGNNQLDPNRPDQFHNLYLQTYPTGGPGFIERNILAGAPNGANIKIGSGRFDPPHPRGIHLRNNTLFAASYNIRLVLGSADNVLERNILGEATRNYNGINAIGPYCLYGRGNVTRSDLWFGALVQRHTDIANRGASGPGCPITKPALSTVLTDANNHVRLDPGFAITPERTFSGALGDFTEDAFRPTVDAAKNYGRFSPFDQVLAADWDGDGVDTPAGVLGNRVYFTNRHEDTAPRGGEAETILAYGSAGDRYVAGDWDGDGDDEIGAYRRSNSTFYLGPAAQSFQYGSAGLNYQPVAGDWDGDGRDEVGLFYVDDRTFFLRSSTGPAESTYATFTFGSVVPARAGDYLAVAGDWNGDGRGEVGLWQRSVHTFHLRPPDGSAARAVTAGESRYRNEYQPLLGRWRPGAPDTVAVVKWNTWERRATNETGDPSFHPPRPFDG